MSRLLMRHAWESELPLAPRIVLLCLASHADARGRCYPSIATLALRTGLGERTVQRALRTLEAAGWLTGVARPHRSTTYFLAVEPPATGPAPAPAPRSRDTPDPAATTPRTPQP